tara:strand:+ start:221 stop:685 length:465 start_codon:yes stop_codon:yes gene_type:complete
MPLVSSTLKNSLQTMFEDAENGVEITPNDWVNAITGYLGAAVTPPGLSVDVESSKGAFLGDVTSWYGGETFLINFPISITTFSIAVMGLANTRLSGTGVVTAPLAPVVLAPPVAIGVAGGSSSAVATSFATILDLHFKTGTYLITGATIPVVWS